VTLSPGMLDMACAGAPACLACWACTLAHVASSAMRTEVETSLAIEKLSCDSDETFHPSHKRGI
jgi:hypothetical protein